MKNVRGKKTGPHDSAYRESEAIHEHTRELEAAYDLLFEEVMRRRELSTSSVSDSLV